MAIMFIFSIHKYADVDRFMRDVHNRGSLKFKYKRSQNTLRIYNIQSINDCMIDMLNDEFSQTDGYKGWLRITTQMLNSMSFAESIDLNYAERKIMRKVCREYEDNEHLLDLMTESKMIAKWALGI